MDAETDPLFNMCCTEILHPPSLPETFQTWKYDMLELGS